MGSAPREENRVPGLVAKSDADNTPVVLEADPVTKRLKVTATLSGAGSGGTSSTDGDAYTAGTSAGTAVIGARDDTGTATLAEDKLGIVRATQYRALHVNLRDASGNELSPGGGTQYTQGGSTVANPTGTAEIWFDGSGNPKAVTPTQPLPSNITDGTNAANTLKSDGTSVGQNSLQVAGTYKEVGSLTAGSLNADLVPSTDVSGYRWIELQIVGTYSGTLTFQGSNDNSNFVSIPLMNSSTTRGSAGTTTTGTAIFYGPVSFRYLRVRMTSYVSGTATGTLELHTVPSTMPTMAVGIADASQNLITTNSTTYTSKFGLDNNLLGTLGTAFSTPGKVDVTGAKTNNNAAPGATNLGVLPAIANAAVQTWTEGDQVLESIDLAGNQRVRFQSTTPTQTSVASSASSVSLLASNTARKGATITNDSSAVLYLKLGTTASTTSYSLAMAGAASAPFAYYEVPFGYTGAIDGIWASATGNARITEIV